MKKYFLIFAALTMVLAGCKKEGSASGDDPQMLTYQGDWYCYQEKADGAIKVSIPAIISNPQFSGIDTTFHVDTTYATPVRYQLTADNYLIQGDADTMATYTYDEVESQLIVSTDRMLKKANIDPTMASMIKIPSSVKVDFSFNATNAKATYQLNESGTIMQFVPYSFNFSGAMYLRR